MTRGLKVHESSIPSSTPTYFLSCLTCTVYNQSQSISSNDWIVDHFEDLNYHEYFMWAKCIKLHLLDHIGYSGYQPAAKLGVLREQCARHILFQKCSTSFVFFIFYFFYRTTSTGAVLLWLSFLLLGQVKTSRSFVARVSLHSLNQPKAFCSACGTALVRARSSPSTSVLPGLLITSQDGTKILTRSAGPFIRGNTFY